MFVENEEYRAFSLEFKRCFQELIDRLSQLWKEYDHKIGVGDPYAYPDFTREEIDKLNGDIDNAVAEEVERIASSFQLKEFKPFMQGFLAYWAEQYREIRWLYHLVDYDAHGRIQNPIDLYSVASSAHQMKLNFIVGEPKIEEGKDPREFLTQYVLDNYREPLDEQAKVIEDNEKDSEDALEVLMDQVIFILFQKSGPQFVELGTVINRKY